VPDEDLAPGVAHNFHILD
jgi:transcriptional accessory protein Tex/SPT6